MARFTPILVLFALFCSVPAFGEGDSKGAAPADVAEVPAKKAAKPVDEAVVEAPPAPVKKAAKPVPVEEPAAEVAPPVKKPAARPVEAPAEDVPAPVKRAAAKPVAEEPAAEAAPAPVKRFATKPAAEEPEIAPAPVKKAARPAPVDQDAEATAAPVKRVAKPAQPAEEVEAPAAPVKRAVKPQPPAAEDAPVAPVKRAAKPVPAAEEAETPAAPVKKVPKPVAEEPEVAAPVKRTAKPAPAEDAEVAAPVKKPAVTTAAPRRRGNAFGSGMPLSFLDRATSSIRRNTPMRNGMIVADEEVSAAFRPVNPVPYCKDWVPGFTEGSPCDLVVLAGGGFLKLRDGMKNSHGVLATAIGYTGGWRKGNVSYSEICQGRTGHTESVMVFFDPTVTKFKRVLADYHTVHDGTVRGRLVGLDAKGNKMGVTRKVTGRQFRSVVYPRTMEQVKIVTQFHRDMYNVTGQRLITDVVPFSGNFVFERQSDDQLLLIREKTEKSIQEAIERHKAQFEARKNDLKEEFLKKKEARQKNALTPPPTFGTRKLVTNAEGQVVTRPPTRAPLVLKRNEQGAPMGKLETIDFKGAVSTVRSRNRAREDMFVELKQFRQEAKKRKEEELGAFQEPEELVE